MRRLRVRCGRRANTLVGVLVALVAIGFLALLLIPAVNGAREAARKAKCNNNLKQIGLAVLTYESQFKSFPCGARVRADVKTGAWIGDWGPSWWIGVAEFAEGGGITRNYRGTEDPSYLSMGTGGATGTPNGLIQNQYVPGYMSCPSSPLAPSISLPNPLSVTSTSVTLPLPTYTGISGTVPDVTAIPIAHDWQTDWQPNVPSVTIPVQGPASRCTQQSMPEGTVGGNGIFPPNQWITIKQILDGASNTILVGEQSGYGIDAANENYKVDIRSCSWYGAWIGMGNTGQQNIKTIDPTLPGTITPYNCTTIAFPINSKIIQNTSSRQQVQITVPGLVGIDLNQIPPAQPSGLGNNNGIQSAHAGGANVVFGDGRAAFLLDSMDFRILLYLGCRDDQRRFTLP